MASLCYVNQTSSPLPLTEQGFLNRFRPTTRNSRLSFRIDTRKQYRSTVCIAAREASTFSLPPEEIAIKENDTFSKYSGYIAASTSAEADQLVEYNVDHISSIFSRRPFLLARRLLQIASTLGRWGFLRYLDSVLGRSDILFKKRAADLRAALVELGPAFVKIAQAISSRPDVIPPEYVAELSLLQDRIAPFDTDAALATIEQELGLPVDLIFSEITPTPVAAASIGQVYQARLRPNNKVVAVKVQRPGVRAAIALDIYILRILAGVIRQVGKFNTDLQGIVDEWASSLFREMDYEAEAQNGLRFRKTFGKLPDIVVPEMFPELSSRKVLVMEWIDGQKLSDVNDLHLIEVGVYCSLSQLLDNGFYHADPHPGNLMRTYDGKLAYLDFGMMGEMPQNLRDSLIEACVHLVNREFDALAEDFVALGLLPPASQKSTVANALTGVFANAVSKGTRNISFGDLSGNLGRTMYQFKFRIPSYFSLVVRSLSVLEGIALNTNPDYKVLGSSYPWIARKVLTDNAPQLRTTLKGLLYKDGVFQIERLESLMTEALRPLTTDSLALKEESNDMSRNTIGKDLLQFVLSDEGSYVRETILDELTKGLDAWNRATLQSTARSVVSNAPVLLPISGQLNLLEDEDVQNLKTFARIRAMLAERVGGSSDENVGNFTEDVDGGINVSLPELIGVFQDSLKLLPAVSTISELPLQAQLQAISVPGEVVGRLTSRIIARTIRNSISRAAENLPLISMNGGNALN